jgi:hypothetical protein
VQHLRELNPALIRWATPPDEPKFALRVPAGLKGEFEEELAQIPPAQRVSVKRHQVRKGDTPASVAKKYGVALQALLDIPNAWRDERPSEADLEAITPFVSQIHFKDWSEAKHQRVAVGEGDIPFRLLLEPLYAAARHRDITFVVETHMPSEPAAATRRSVRALKALAA